VIGVAAGSKEGELANFSSRGMRAELRLTNEDPLDDFNAPTITAPGRAVFYEINAGKFTSDIVSVRSTVNITANGLNADAELPAGHVPFYTQISGTSMATPYAAGVAALMLDADPTLTPDEIRTILTSTASKMPGREEWEVGAGFINAHAAVDKVFNRNSLTQISKTPRSTSSSTNISRCRNFTLTTIRPSRDLVRQIRPLSLFSRA
jgi:serine protease AprX